MSSLGKRIRRIVDAETEDFLELLDISDLDPAKDIRFMDLRGVDFSGCDLSGIDFTGAQLAGCEFEGASIAEAVFDETQMRLKSLEGAQDYPSFFERIPNEIKARMSEEQQSRDRVALGEAVEEQNVGLVRNLLMQGVDPDVSNDRHFPLYKLARTGNAEIANLLLEFGANPNKLYNTRNFSNYESPLIIACTHGNFGVAKALVAYGADIEHVTESGQNPLSSACEGNHSRIAEFLLDQGAKTEIAYFGNAPLINASEANLSNLVRLLIEHGADVNGRDDWQNTALIEACKNDANESAELLLSLEGIDVDAANRNGTTALMVSAANGNISLVDLLLNAGADPLMTNKNGSSARQIASGKRIREILHQAEVRWKQKD